MLDLSPHVASLLTLGSSFHSVLRSETTNEHVFPCPGCPAPHQVAFWDHGAIQEPEDRITTSVQQGAPRQAETPCIGCLYNRHPTEVILVLSRILGGTGSAEHAFSFK